MERSLPLNQKQVPETEGNTRGYRSKSATVLSLNEAHRCGTVLPFPPGPGSHFVGTQHSPHNDLDELFYSPTVEAPSGGVVGILMHVLEDWRRDPGFVPSQH